MRWLRRKNRERKERNPTRLLAWAIVLGLIFALVRAGEYPEDRLRAVRNHLNERPASGEIVMVGIDEKSLREVGRWPWPRGRYAELVDAIEAANPRQQVHDIMFPDRSDPEQDRQLAAAFARSKNVTLAYLPRTGAQSGKFEDVRPLPEFRKHAGVGTIALQYNYANEGWMLPLGTERGSAVIPSLATVLAQRYSGRSEEFRVNYAFDPASIRTLSAADVIAGRHRDELRGKTVVVGLAAERLGDQFMLPGWGKMSGVYIHIIGAETLKAGKPIDLGWIPAFLIATALVCLTIKRTGRQQIVALGLGVIALLVIPALLERSQVFADVTPGLFVISWVGIGLLLRNAKRRGLTNAISGLPNLNALRRANSERDRPLIVARVVNYAQIVSTLTQANERS